MLLDMLTALALCGVIFYAIAAAFERRGSVAMSTAVLLLFTIAPFSIRAAGVSQPIGRLQPAVRLAVLPAVGIALIVTGASGRVSTTPACSIRTRLILIADRNRWFDKPAWAITIVAVGISAPTVEFVLDAQRRKVRLVTHAIDAREPSGRDEAPSLNRGEEAVAAHLQDAAHFPGGKADAIARPRSKERSPRCCSARSACCRSGRNRQSRVVRRRRWLAALDRSV